MTDHHSSPHHPKPEEAVIQWLLDSDPAIRWQVMRDLTGEPDEVVATERWRVASEGWAAQLLARQKPDGTWGAASSTANWETTLYTILLLRDMGLDPMSEHTRAAVGLLRDNFTWGQEFGSPRAFFDSFGGRSGRGGDNRPMATFAGVTRAAEEIS